MSLQWAIAIGVHQLATLVWIGGMFFAHVILRPVAADILDPPERLTLMLRVFNRFFPWVWLSVISLWASGLWILAALLGGHAGGHVHAMMGVAAVMTALFTYIWFVPYLRMRAAVTVADWSTAGASLAVIRKVILTNLILGLANAVLGAVGPRMLASITSL